MGIEIADNWMHFECINLFRLWIERGVNKWLSTMHFWGKTEKNPKIDNNEQKCKKKNIETFKKCQNSKCEF